MTAVVTEGITGEEYSAEETIRFEYRLLKIKFSENTPETFKDEMTFVGFVSILNIFIYYK